VRPQLNERAECSEQQNFPEIRTSIGFSLLPAIVGPRATWIRSESNLGTARHDAWLVFKAASHLAHPIPAPDAALCHPHPTPPRNRTASVRRLIDAPTFRSRPRGPCGDRKTGAVSAWIARQLVARKKDMRPAAGRLPPRQLQTLPPPAPAMAAPGLAHTRPQERRPPEQVVAANAGRVQEAPAGAGGFRPQQRPRLAAEAGQPGYCPSTTWRRILLGQRWQRRTAAGRNSQARQLVSDHRSSRMPAAAARSHGWAAALEAGVGLVAVPRRQHGPRTQQRLIEARALRQLCARHGGPVHSSTDRSIWPWPWRRWGPPRPGGPAPGHRFRGACSAAGPPDGRSNQPAWSSSQAAWPTALRLRRGGAVHARPPSRDVSGGVGLCCARRRRPVRSSFRFGGIDASKPGSGGGAKAPRQVAVGRA